MDMGIKQWAGWQDQSDSESVTSVVLPQQQVWPSAGLSPDMFKELLCHAAHLTQNEEINEAEILILLWLVLIWGLAGVKTGVSLRLFQLMPGFRQLGHRAGSMQSSMHACIFSACLQFYI